MQTQSDKPRFELVSQFADQTDLLPQRATKFSAGYDFFVAQDTIVPAFSKKTKRVNSHIDTEKMKGRMPEYKPLFDLDEAAKITKDAQEKLTMVPTGVKAYLPEGTYLQLAVRSSCPLKHWLILGNGVGIVDCDYYNNPDNEGHIYFMIANLFPYDILLRRGDRIGQGIILPYFLAEDDNATAARVGGYGSTGS